MATSSPSTGVLLTQPSAGSRDTTGNWSTLPISLYDSTYNFLSIDVDMPYLNNQNPASVSYYPAINETANYTASFYTPGCASYNTCSRRTIVTVACTFDSSDPSIYSVYSSFNVNQTVFQNTWQDFYSGPVSKASSVSKPLVMLMNEGPSGENLNIVAPVLRFTSSTASSSPSLPPSSATPSPSPLSNGDSGLSMGTKAGIGTGVGIAVLLISALVAMISIGRQKVRKMKRMMDKDHILGKDKPELHSECVNKPQSPVALEAPPQELDPEDEMYEIDSRALVAEAPNEVANELDVTEHHPSTRRNG